MKFSYKLSEITYIAINTNSWEQRKFSEGVSEVGDGLHGTPTYCDDGNIYFINGNNLVDGKIVISAETKKVNENQQSVADKSLNNTTILMSINGTIGNLAYYSGEKLMLGKSAAYIKTSAFDKRFVYAYLQAPTIQTYFMDNLTGTTIKNLGLRAIREMKMFVPLDVGEQKRIGEFFENLDNLITLHQRKRSKQNWRYIVLEQAKTTDLFSDYYAQWVHIYKEGAIRKVTLNKYMMTLSWIKKLIPDVKLCDMSRITYQKLLNDYAKEHERQTTMDFHHQLKGAILDAVDEGLIERDPTRKVIIKGKTPTEKKIKYLNQFELHTLLTGLDLGKEINWDWFILLVAKTGMRFSETIALTPKDFDFSHQSLSISKTWDYKGDGGFLPTKNKSSVRKIQIDWQTVVQFSELLKDIPADQPIFVTEGKKVYNSTVNDILERHCKKDKLPVISVHGLRHTHASLLLFAGVSIGSVARRLGHASMTTTQKTYLHIIHELENQDVDLVMKSLASLY